jgi:hypothetical protein
MIGEEIGTGIGAGTKTRAEIAIGTGMKMRTTPDNANLSDPVFTDSALGLFAEHELFTVFHSGLIRLTPAGRHYYRDALAAMQGSLAPDAKVEEEDRDGEAIVEVERVVETGITTGASAAKRSARVTVSANKKMFKRVDPWAAYPIDQMLYLISEGEKRVARSAQRDAPLVTSWGPLVDALHDRLASALFVEKDAKKAAQLVERSKTMIAHSERVRDGIDPNQTTVPLERDRDREE